MRVRFQRFQCLSLDTSQYARKEEEDLTDTEVLGRRRTVSNRGVDDFSTALCGVEVLLVSIVTIFRAAAISVSAG